jgi:hypothetical protein
VGEALRRGWAVTELFLMGNCQIGDDGARALAATLEQCASRCSLSRLSLDRCSLTPAGTLALIRAAPRVPSLHSLSLRLNLSIPDKPALLAACGDKSHFKLGV